MTMETIIEKPETADETLNGGLLSPPPCYALHWRYSDGYASGVIPHLFTEAEKDVVSKVFDEIEPCKDVEWILLHNSQDPRQA
jgi:hypothetical protein